MHGVGRIGHSRVDGAALVGALQDGGAIAADNAAGKMMFLEREAEGASNQAGSDDGDLFERHL
jgi:hypothetical protein